MCELNFTNCGENAKRAASRAVSQTFFHKTRPAHTHAWPPYVIWFCVRWTHKRHAVDLSTTAFRSPAAQVVIRRQWQSHCSAVSRLKNTGLQPKDLREKEVSLPEGEEMHPIHQKKKNTGYRTDRPSHVAVEDVKKEIPAGQWHSTRVHGETSVSKVQSRSTREQTRFNQEVRKREGSLTFLLST